MGGFMRFRRGAQRASAAAARKVEQLQVSTAGDHLMEGPHWVIGARSGFQAWCACGWKSALYDTQTAAKRRAWEHSIRANRTVVDPS